MAKAAAKTSNKPVISLRWSGVSFVSFENYTEKDGQDVMFLKHKIQKTYKEGDEFKTTESLSTRDLLVLRSLIDEALPKIREMESTRNKDEA